MANVTQKVTDAIPTSQFKQQKATYPVTNIGHLKADQAMVHQGTPPVVKPGVIGGVPAIDRIQHIVTALRGKPISGT